MNSRSQAETLSCAESQKEKVTFVLCRVHSPTNALLLI